MSSPERLSSPEPEVVELNKPICCVIDAGLRCDSPATSATFNKRFYKPVLHRGRRQELSPDPEVECPACVVGEIIVKSNTNMYIDVSLWCALNGTYRFEPHCSCRRATATCASTTEDCCTA